MSENGDSGPSSLEKKIIKQIEFYFGDVNLVRDKFLQAEIKADDGWVPLSTMVRFNRLKQLTEDYETITTALKKSHTGLMEVSEDGQKIRRNPDQPLPEITKDRVVDTRKRTVYAKSFPLDSTLDNLMEFFEECGSVELVKMRRDSDKKFKGSVFTTYLTLESAQKFMADKRTYGEGDKAVELTTYFQEDYFKMKNELKKNHDEKKKGEQQAAKRKKEEDYEAEQEKILLESITKGALLELTGLKDTTQREDIAAIFNQYSTIAWQDFKKGDTKAVIRFEDEDGAKNAWEKAVSSAEDGKVCVLEQEVQGRILEGEEEIAQWKLMRQTQLERKKSRHGKHGKKPRGRGGRHDRNDEKAAGGDEENKDNDEPPAKVQKTEGSEERKDNDEPPAKVQKTEESGE